MATKDEIFAFAAKEADLQGVPASLVRNVIEAESGGSFNAIGPKTRFNDRAYGPMQLMGETAKDLGVNRMDWQDNIRGGVKYLSQLSNRFQDPTLVAAAYNAGPGNVEKYGGVPPFKETQNYVKKVVGMAKDESDWKPVTGISQEPTVSTSQPQTSSDENWKPVTGIGATTAQQVNQAQPTGQSQFMQDVQSSFNPMDVLRGKTTSGQLIFGAADLMAQGIKGGLSKLGLSDEYLGIDRNKSQPVSQPTQSISDILKGTYKVATERPGLLVGGAATGLLDPANLVLPGAIQKSIVSATPAALVKAAPRAVAAAQNVATGATTAGITSAAQQQATTGIINPMQALNEAAVGGLLTAPTASLGAVTTPKAPPVLTQQQQIAKTAIDQGVTLPPTQVNPSLINSLLEGISGKQTTSQIASIKNQAVVNTQARKALGLADDVQITPQVLQDYRNTKGQAYEALKSNNAYYTDKKFITDINNKTSELQKLANTTDVSAELNVVNGLKQMAFDGVGLVEQMKRLRFDGEKNLVSMDPANQALGKAQKFAAKQLEDLAERNLQKFNQPDVMENFKKARQDIAKSYTIEKSLNAATGDVSGAKLGQRAAQGKILPPELQALGSAAAAFPKAFQSPSAVGSVPMISPLDLGSAAIASAASGSPLVMASALTRPAVRAGITSQMFQRNMLPNTQVKTPGLLNRITTDPMISYGLGQMPEYGTERFLLPR
jgi:hypothetical protein